MEIHIVQPGDTIFTIADKYKVPAERIILDNNINTNKLVIGQAIVILFPTETYIVKQGDSVESIAATYNIPVMQLHRNNSFLSDRDIFPGETLIINYNNDKGNISTFGFAYSYIDNNILNKTLPYLTYLCVFGNQITDEAEIITISDEELIKNAKSFGVSPIMLLSSYIQQELNYVDSTYNILADEKLSDKLINNIINLIISKGYLGLCITLEYLSSFNLIIYQNYIKKLYKSLKIKGLELYITISPESLVISEGLFKKIDPDIENYLDGIIFMNYKKDLNIYSPPSPVTSINKLEEFLNVCVTIINEEKINIGCPVMGLDWELPYITNVSKLTILKYYTAIEIAQDKKSIIYFDDSSQTPYFTYDELSLRGSIQHIVWFVDANTINSLVNLIPEFNLNGSGIWNIMYFFAPLWAILNSQYKINKLFPEP